MSTALTRLNLARSRVLVVDDNARAMEVLSQILLGLGITQARKIASPQDARTPAGHEPFDLILVDHDMGDESGIDFCRFLRSDPKASNFTTAVILLTTLPSAQTVRAARDAGANFVLAKPITPAVLLDRIEWIARETRPFITSDTYRGPDRRFQSQALPEGIEERRADALRLMEAPERAMSQDEINSLFD
jgi:CheY-like chemotaxis protein